MPAPSSADSSVGRTLWRIHSDWAFVREEPAGHYLYMVREIRRGPVLDELRFEHEQLKIKFGSAHFSGISVDYAFGRAPRFLLRRAMTTHTTPLREHISRGIDHLGGSHRSSTGAM